MEEYRIRMNSTDSVNSNNKNNFINLDLVNHTKIFPVPDIRKSVDQHEIFEKEYNACDQYRLILTINPYCTNVLFNPITEIVRNEGSDKLIIVESGVSDESNGIDLVPNKKTGENTDIIGKDHNLTTSDMIQNTEYASINNPFTYHCGYDFFNNHILRSLTFKIVNPIQKNMLGFVIKEDKNNGSTTRTMKDMFNTISDFMRYSDGSFVPLYKRTDLVTLEEEKNDKFRRLYIKEDIMSFIDSINTNLIEMNGWFGFNNRNKIKSLQFSGNAQKNGKWDDMKISNALWNGNNKDNFIELYPDSTLYSFNPKYNPYRNRLEYNWDIVLSYPYENDETHPLVKGFLQNGKETNSLLLCSAKQGLGTSNQKIVLFRSFVKHNLKPGDKIKILFSKDEQHDDNTSINFNNNGDKRVHGFYEIEDKLFDVVNIGDLNANNKEYYFYINDVDDIIEYINNTFNLNLDSIPLYFNYRFVKINNNYPCKYYFRKFKQLENINDVSIKHENTEDKTNSFSNEVYPLAFSNTIYNDQKTQVIFNDSIQTGGLTDNLNRPLTTIYATIFKRNKGHDVWYKRNKTKQDLEKIEYSHCFGILNSGLEIYTEYDDIYDKHIMSARELINDVTLITNNKYNFIIKNNKNYNFFQSYVFDYDLTVEKSHEFFGDLVELDTTIFKETILGDICFRFNTEQREHFFGKDEIHCGKFVYDEIISDDYDYDGFKIETQEIVKKVQYRKEGYYYKPNYPIQIKNFGPVNQSSHHEIIIKSCKPKQAGGLFLEVLSENVTGVKIGDIVYLYDKINNETYELTVYSVINRLRFLLNPMQNIDNEKYLNIFEMIDGLQGDNPRYILLLKNNKIPDHAYKLEDNIYIWRNILNINEFSANDVDNPFANGHIYLNKEINFFLKRQDPFGKNGMMDSNIVPNDVYGNNASQITTQNYKEEIESIC